MKWLETIRHKPYHEKIRIMWIVVIVAAVLLIVIWVITARIQKNLPKDTTFFQTIQRGFHDVGEQYKQGKQ